MGGAHLERGVYMVSSTSESVQITELVPLRTKNARCFRCARQGIRLAFYRPPRRQSTTEYGELRNHNAKRDPGPDQGLILFFFIFSVTASAALQLVFGGP